jgi:hypothetical protein
MCSPRRTRHNYSLFLKCNKVAFNSSFHYFSSLSNQEMLEQVLGRKWKMNRAQLFISAFLACYLLASGSEVLHRCLHAHHNTKHGYILESDACLQSIYRINTATACDHDSHWVVSDKCWLCDSIVYRDYLWLPATSSTDIDLYWYSFIVYQQHVESRCMVISSSRAPPAT